jgi:hypothetical protein
MIDVHVSSRRWKLVVDFVGDDDTVGQRRNLRVGRASMSFKASTRCSIVGLVD